MGTKVPVVLVVLVDGARLRWLVAAVDLGGTVAPLVRSEDGDLATYQKEIEAGIALVTQAAQVSSSPSPSPTPTPSASPSG